MRDGGYINDWKFGHSTMMSVYKRLEESGVDYIEVGFLDDRRQYDPNRSIQPSTDCYNKIYSGVHKKHAIPVAMIDYGTCDIENISDAKDSFIEGIRIIFKKERIDQALPFCCAVKEKGYKLFIQAISVTAYSDLEMLEYIQKINEVHPFAFSIVDTYGLLNNRRMAHYFDLLDNNLLPDIKVGYHDHNNFQLAFSNTMKFLELKTKRTIIADASVYGMGKSAGNCAIELIAMYMNESFGKCYDINQYLEIFDTDLSLVYQKHYWGYKYNYYISAMQNCHPNYVEYLLNKKTLTITAVNKILSNIPEEIKLLYNKEYIENAYTEYQSNAIDDSKAVSILTGNLKERNILLVGPGSSLIKERETIINFIDSKNPIIVSVNFNPEFIQSDYIFLSNAKRYITLLDNDFGGAHLIITSNVTDYENKADYVLNYESSLKEGFGKNDNALLLLLNNLCRFGIKRVTLAGFDGYKENVPNYSDSSYNFAGNEKYKISNNSVISESLKKLESEIQINFLTESLYK